MPKGPRGERRPADVIGNPAAELGRKGGEARAKAMTPERRAEIAKKAAAKRWGQDQ